MTRSRAFLWLCRLFPGLVFIAAGALKVSDPLSFAQSIQNYRVFPAGISLLLALFLPWLEILAGLGLITGLACRASSLLLSLLLVGFIILVGSAVARGIDTSCGCFGQFSHKADLTLMALDALLLALVLVVFTSSPKNKNLP